MIDYQDTEEIREILGNSKTIAVVGISDKPHRSSFGVAEYLSQYYTVIPINPNLKEWQGRTCYPSILAVPDDLKIDLVDIFRKSSEVPELVDQALERGVPYIWMQQGVIDFAAAEKARAAGCKVVMDACTAVGHATVIRSGT